MVPGPEDGEEAIKRIRSLERGGSTALQMDEIRPKRWDDEKSKPVVYFPCTALTVDRYAQLNIVSETWYYF